MTFHIDPGDPPSQMEAEADMQDTRTPLEKAIDIGAYLSGSPGKYSVCVGHPARQSLLVSSIEVGRALVTILNLSDPGELELIMSSLLRAYGEKTIRQANAYGEAFEAEDAPNWGDDWDEEDPAF